jgi:hypothetical protein
LSINLNTILLILICALLLNFGCATRSPKIVMPPTPAPEPIPAPKAPEPQPHATAPEPVEPSKAPPSEPAAPELPAPAPKSTVPSTVQSDRSAPRSVASLRLTEQARLLIESKKPDEAIGILEKAMNIDTSNGQNYYYLAEAWILKGNKSQAGEFNRMAGLYLSSESDWKLKIQQQKERISKMKIVH